ncbi:MAG: sigma-54-dependent Fis family transcriptional regulator, partial [Deltaproteobacteria bacterium]|nr:sigma-54-dependent Fis family transcriptional regulator [Deltaproteobacteria bacterium]
MPAHLLVVDDEPNTRKTLRRALELAGYSVSTAESVADARQRIEERDADLCLLDVRLPDGNGIGLLSDLKKLARPPEVVMMSGDASIDDAVKALGLGARDFLEKPIGQDRLLLTIENVLRLSKLEVENRELKERAVEADELLGRSQPMRELLLAIERVGPTEGRVLITGENGSGKELVARA